MQAAPTARPHLSRYTVRCSDVLAELRVSVLEEGTDKVMWYKKRTMTEDEIIESIMDSASNAVRWTVHRPKRGWYLRLRCPSFPPESFIPLVPPTLAPPNPASPPSPALPPPATAPVASRPSDGTLTFSVRTVSWVPEKPSPQDETKTNAGMHSYPPSPPVAPSISQQSLQVPTPSEINAKLRALQPCYDVTGFLLSPSFQGSVTPPPTSSNMPRALLSRALTYLSPSLPIRATFSFTLTPLTIPGETSTPLLTFTDTTSTFSVLTTGQLEVNRGLEHKLGVDPTFWIAVALCYLEFLADRDSYLSAADG